MAQECVYNSLLKWVGKSFNPNFTALKLPC